ncbi:SOS response associated peptidase SRAP [Nitzschia inconspicua]|uniref:SOS response associated peptidase SRAP n=1 Tax=Nitzschia inconspicua TaxID=303405 RepID=A0A9K3KDC7_9STRA|nr:SOS response associated peptidase SRAP [Nitzschia inconspicua]
MCGRAVQTQYAAITAAKTFGASSQHALESSHRDETTNDQQFNESGRKIHHNKEASTIHRDNFNMSPGMDVMVIYQEQGKLLMNHKKWGLISRSGTVNKPLFETDKDILQLCFANLCYNARSDTLFAKPTFSRLALQGKTCIVALDGYFEWKSTPLVKGKQPYFVYRNTKNQQNDGRDLLSSQQRQPLFMAGLWTRVSTGHVDQPTIDSFSILTTEACPQISWLHHRMPLCVWDVDLARQWLSNPSERLKNQLDDAAKQETDCFAWHKVTTAMSTLKFRGQEAIQPVKETTQSVKTFFNTTKKSSSDDKSAISETKSAKNVYSSYSVQGEKLTSHTSAIHDQHEVLIKSEENPRVEVVTKKRPLNDFTSTTKQEVSGCQSSNTETLSHSTPNKKSKTNLSPPTPAGSKQQSITSFFQRKR